MGKEPAAAALCNEEHPKGPGTRFRLDGRRSFPNPQSQVGDRFPVTQALHANRWSSPSEGRTLVFHPGCETILFGSPIVMPSGRRQSHKSVCASEPNARFDRDQ